jgi:hypothetical protein
MGPGGHHRHPDIGDLWPDEAQLDPTGDTRWYEPVPGEPELAAPAEPTTSTAVERWYDASRYDQVSVEPLGLEPRVYQQAGATPAGSEPDGADLPGYDRPDYDRPGYQPPRRSTMAEFVADGPYVRPRRPSFRDALSPRHIAPQMRASMGARAGLVGGTVLLVGALSFAAIATVRNSDDSNQSSASSGSTGLAAPASSLKPTHTASPTPSRSRASSEWPGKDNTGVPPGVKLKDYNGPDTITRSGTVINGALIHRCLEISARNVKIINSKLVCNDIMLTVHEASGSLTVEDSEMDGQGSGFVAGYNNLTMKRVNMHNINEGPRLGSNMVIQDCWIHGLVYAGPDGHQDVLQTNGGTNVVVRHNRLDALPDPPETVPDGWYFNAVFQVGAEFGGPTADYLFEDNLVDGGDYTINIRDDPNMDHLVFKNNQFGRHHAYGPVTGTTVDGVDWDRKSNVYKGTKTPVRP